MARHSPHEFDYVYTFLTEHTDYDAARSTARSSGQAVHWGTFRGVTVRYSHHGQRGKAITPTVAAGDAVRGISRHLRGIGEDALADAWLTYARPLVPRR
jgi:hypothetical protein